MKTLQQLNQDFITACVAEKNEAGSFTMSNSLDAFAKLSFETEDNTREVQIIVSTASGDTDDTAGPPCETVCEAPQDAATVVKYITKETPVWKNLLFFLVKIASIILAFLLLFTFLFGLVRIEDPSMDPVIKDGDLVFFYRYKGIGYSPGDAIALKKDGQIQIRRVVATAGDTVDIVEEGLVINGSLQQEFGIFHKTDRYVDGADFPLTVGEGQAFVLGDNRIFAMDSRIYGTVRIKDTLGKVMTVIRRRNI